MVLIPEAEALVSSFRNKHDPSAAIGVPAHVTVVYPFKPPDNLTSETIETLTKLFGGFPAFDVSFVELTGVSGVLWLAPTPDENFRRLMKLVTEKFPEAPPYSGQFADVIPHLTIAQDDDPGILRKIAQDFEDKARNALPIQARVAQVALMDNKSGRWQVRRRFALGSQIV